VCCCSTGANELTLCFVLFIVMVVVLCCVNMVSYDPLCTGAGALILFRHPTHLDSDRVQRCCNINQRLPARNALRAASTKRLCADCMMHLCMQRRGRRGRADAARRKKVILFAVTNSVRAFMRPHMPCVKLGKLVHCYMHRVQVSRHGQHAQCAIVHAGSCSRVAQQKSCGHRFALQRALQRASGDSSIMRCHAGSLGCFMRAP
jgi:hypothetical protein